jgi:hypothetical protein
MVGKALKNKSLLVLFCRKEHAFLKFLARLAG